MPEFDSHELPRGRNEFEQRYKYSIDESLKVGTPVPATKRSTPTIYNIWRVDDHIILDCNKHGRLGEFATIVNANVAMVRHNREQHKSKGYTLHEDR